MKNYTGRLLPYRPIIAGLLLAGVSVSSIARLLVAMGARSDWCHLGVDNVHSTAGLVHALNRKWISTHPRRKLKIGTFRAPITDSWTPEDVWRETEGIK